MDSQEPDHAFSAADRIEQLNEIDRDATKLLRAAGLAVQALTNIPLSNGGTKDSHSPSSKSALEAHQEAFKAASSQYFALLSSIDVRLRRQVYALEEASIIRPETTTKTAEGSSTAAFNPLETSWLNTRKDSVGKDKEAELWAEAKDLVMKLGSMDAEDPSAERNSDTQLKPMEID
ncbi:hypothetical protein CPC735_070670 [Coccidioides posadasii C735 delta SOWgp]|uniref:Mediator of RNA polymerase II transcription subunit 11 n=1 Tax=Coccidioides posadasii (strain C735) TaxID=222929 RepID=C5P127_COCP7|nr:hypothetical protein CPC735_070670 [Coccidioides posadasii C735 delta SOWgp]EER29385.1 hypothetical protein CPC735_070670 [Coccidioides posadasii C735 delta SOWgp]|eukprot:XP_003071530.1 hypothetical protein CPC735_070670 [Coccidioides posadasii C735 delta SOWgp]